MHQQGQVEAEAIVAVILVMVFFVAISFLLLSRSNEADFFKRQGIALSECSKIALAINSFSSSSGFEEIFLETETDFNVAGQTVYIGEFSCNFFGEALPATLARGTINVFEGQTGVRIENA